MQALLEGELRGGAVIRLHTLRPASSPHPASAHHLLKSQPLRRGPLWEGADTRRENGRTDAVSMVQKAAQRHLLFCPSFSSCLPSRSGASLLPPLPRHRGLLKFWDIRPADPPHTEGVGSLQQSLPKDHFQGAHGHLRAFSAPSPFSLTLCGRSPPRKPSLFLITEK